MQEAKRFETYLAWTYTDDRHAYYEIYYPVFFIKQTNSI